MDSAINFTLWTNLALDVCPHCQNKGLLITHQATMSATFLCQKCHSRYWMSVLRSQGACQLQ